MSSVDRWVDREARRAARRPTLAEALLSGRPWRYAVYRTRYLLLRVPVRVGLHLAEVVLLGFLFPLEELGPIFAIRALMSVSASLHWGALEALREEVRDHARQRAWSKAVTVIRIWLLRSVDIGLAQLGLAALWVWVGPSEFTSFSIFDAYALAAGVRVLFETVARTYAAGIGAFRRIPRPLWAGILGDVLDLGGALIVWPFAGAWGFAGALLAAGMLRASLVVVFARRAYRISPLRSLRWQPPRRRRLGHLAPGVKRKAFVTAVGNATSQLDAWIVLALAAAARTEQQAVVVAAFHVLRPLLTASTGWVRLFYLDLKQLERKGRLLQKRLERLLVRLGLAFALATSALLLAIWPLLWGRGLDALALWLAPFLIGRAVFSVYQMQAFSYGRNRYLLGTAAIVGLGLLTVTAIPVIGQHALPFITILLGVLVLVAGAPRGPLRASSSNIVGLYRWLALVSSEPESGRVVSAVADKNISVSLRRIAKQIARAREGPMTTWGRRQLIWFETRTDRPPVGQAVAVASGGCLAALRVGPFSDNGRDALSRAIEAGVLERNLAERLGRDHAESRAALSADFRREFPEGVVLDARRGKVDAVQSGRAGWRSSLWLRGTLKEILRVSRGPGGTPARNVPGHVFVFAPGGEPDLVLVAPRETKRELRRRWRQRVEDATMAASRRRGGR